MSQRHSLCIQFPGDDLVLNLIWLPKEIKATGGVAVTVDDRGMIILTYALKLTWLLIIM